MAKSSKTFDVFIAYNHRDAKHAAVVVEVLQSFDLAVFFDAHEIVTGDTIEDTVWQAMAESHAVVAVVPEDAPSSWMAFELGAARAWNKPIYAVSPASTLGRPPVALQSIEILPLSRTEEIARSILDSREAFSDDDQRKLGESYRKIGVAVDQLALQPQRLARLVDDFNRRSGKQLSGEQVMWLLLRLRKSRGLPSLRRRNSKSAI